MARPCRPDLHYWQNYLTDTKQIVTAPVRWQDVDWYKALALTTAAIGFYNYDAAINNFAHDHKTGTSDEIAKSVRPFGDPKYSLPPLALFYLYGHLFSNEKAQCTALLALESFVISSGFSSALKFAGHRHRPNSGDPYNIWDGPGLEGEHLSFPSGHATTSFAIMTVIASQYDDKILIPIISYSIATLTSLSRIHDQEHWASDVFVGSVVGFVTARTILNRSRIDKEKKLNFLPTIEGNQICLGILYRF